MNQQEYKYIAYCLPEHGVERVIMGNSIEELQNKIDDWYENGNQGYTPYESHYIDNTICISDFQFLIYTRDQNGTS